jgi:peptide deformylase
MIVQDAEFLRQKSTDVETVQEVEEIIQKLKQELALKPNGVGLAAIQIGIPKKVSYITNQRRELILINASIIETDDEFVFCGEGCLSFPGDYINTKRYKDIVIQNFEIRDGKLQEQKISLYYDSEPGINNDGIMCIAAQHEIEHFEGKILIDKINVSIEPRRVHKVGRNEPCPCGSGKKYKRCCGV